MKKRRYICLFLGLALLLGSTGCRQQIPEGALSSGKTVVTMMYPSGLNRFEALVETSCQDIDLQVEPTTTAMMNGDSERRLRNSHGTDLVVTTLPTT